MLRLFIDFCVLAGCAGVIARAAATEATELQPNAQVEVLTSS